MKKQRVPVPANSIAVRCGEGEVTVEVKRNFLGNVVFNPQSFKMASALMSRKRKGLKL